MTKLEQKNGAHHHPDVHFHSHSGEMHHEFTYVAMFCRNTSISRRTCRLRYAGRSRLVGDIDNGGRLLNTDLQKHVTNTSIL